MCATNSSHRLTVDSYNPEWLEGPADCHQQAVTVAADAGRPGVLPEGIMREKLVTSAGSVPGVEHALLDRQVWIMLSYPHPQPLLPLR